MCPSTMIATGRTGQPRADLSMAAQEGVLTELPVLPRSHDAATTALYIQSVIGGEKPMPAPLEQQVQTLLRALAGMAHHTEGLGLTA